MINNLQILRAYAAISVVLLHLSYPLLFGVPVGNFGVDIFFVISGFIMARICDNNPDQFLLRRVIRIVPIYWALTIILFLAAIVSPHLLSSTHANGKELLKSLFFIPYQRADGFFAPVLVRGWTLNYEFYFYALIAVGLIFSKRYATTIASTLLIATKLCIGYFHWDALSFYSRDIVLEFVFGVLIYEIVIRMERDSLRKISLGGLAFASVIALAVFERRFSINFERAWILGIPAAILVGSFVLLESKLTGLWKRTLILFGDASYMIYLTHPYIMQPTEKVLMRVGGSLQPARLLGAVVVTCAAIAAGVMTHLYVELPILNVLKRPLMQRSVQASCAAARTTPQTYQTNRIAAGVAS